MTVLRDEETYLWLPEYQSDFEEFPAFLYSGNQDHIYGFIYLLVFETLKLEDEFFS